MAAWILVPDPRAELAATPLPATLAIYDRNGVPLYQALDPERGKAIYVPLGEVSEQLVHATIATEDATFYSNPGVDPVAILRALVQNWRSEGLVSGGSTLTQQLVRNRWMTAEERGKRSLGRKLREAVLALRLAVHLSKDDILEQYLNTAPYGHQAVGVEAAARVYFGKRARDLDLAESALLAGLPQAPSAYDPLLEPERARARQQVVLSLMARQGYITNEEAEAAASEPIHLAAAAFPIRAPHFVAYILQSLAEDPRLDPAVAGSVRVYTTLDLGLQELAEAAVKRNVAALADKHVTDGALVALDPRTGEILAMVGSADYFDRSIGGEVNVALAARQPGSSIKPILYAAALERGLTAATVLYDVPTSFQTADGKSYSPENYDKVWHGPVSVRDALANSYNLPAVKVLQWLGVGPFLSEATEVGLTTLAGKGAGDLSLALGSGEVRPLDMAAAFAAFADGGVRREPVAILRVEGTDGSTPPPGPLPAAGRGSDSALTLTLSQGERGGGERVVSPQVAYLITSILSDNGARAASFGTASPLRLSRPAAAKTGTTTDWRDNWTVGYTPELVTAVWVGNADNTPMEGVSGISGAAPIWHDFMEEALKGRPVTEFSRPPGLVSVEVCPESGELPSPWCPNRRTELFVEGTEPKTVCTWHQAVKIDRSTGQLAGPNCPPELVDERVFLVVPPELEAWALERGVPEPPTEMCGLHGGAAEEDVMGAPEGYSVGAPRVVLTSPSTGAVLQISPELPMELQRVEVAAAASGLGSGVRVELRVDGTRLAMFDGPPYRATWELVAGRHRFEAVVVAADGRELAAAEAEVVVERAATRP